MMTNNKIADRYKTRKPWKTRNVNQSIREFWKNVDICKHGQHCKKCCWEWMGKAGTTYFYGKMYPVARLSLILSDNAFILPMHIVVCHGCDNPPCCNPYHLWPGTPSDNYQDMLAKQGKSRRVFVPQKPAYWKSAQEEKRKKGLPYWDDNGEIIVPNYRADPMASRTWEANRHHRHAD